MSSSHIPELELLGGAVIRILAAYLLCYRAGTSCLASNRAAHFVARLSCRLMLLLACGREPDVGLCSTSRV